MRILKNDIVRDSISVAALTLLLVGLFAFGGGNGVTPEKSVELGFTAASPAGPSGGLVVPASCPSFAHSPGECDGGGYSYQYPTPSYGYQTPSYGYQYQYQSPYSQGAYLPSLSIESDPDIVSPGDTTVITWSASNIEAGSCLVTEDNDDINDVFSGDSGSQTTSALFSQTTYTLSCDTQSGGTASASVTIIINPEFEEF